MGGYFLVSVIAWIIIFVAWFFNRKYPLKKNVEKIDRTIRYNLTIIVFQLLMNEIFLASSSAIFAPAKSNVLGPASYAVAGLIVVYFLIFIGFITKILNTEELYHIDVHPRYNSLWLGCRIITKLD